jgi:zinc and cadmium transporter
MLLLWITVFSLLGSLGAIIASFLFLLFPEKKQDSLLPYFISYASGTLLTTALLGLIPHALEHASSSMVFTTVLGGIILFFVLEKLLIWRHCHDLDCEIHGTAGSIILIGDTLHNFVDGVVITAGFISSIPIGILTSLSVIAHEIPQEVGDFAILLHNGYTKRKALTYNVVSSLSSVPGAILAYFILDIVNFAIPFVMAISAASFLYIALADLTPKLHHHLKLEYDFLHFTMMLLGVGTIFLILQFQP